MKRTYKSRVSVILAVFSALIMTVSVGAAVMSKETETEDLIALITAILVFILVYTGTYYRIEDRRIKVYTFFLPFQNIPVDEIKEITPTRSLLSAPALSMDRIEIKYGKYGRSVISPKSQEEFLQEIRKLNNKIEFNF